MGFLFLNYEHHLFFGRGLNTKIEPLQSGVSGLMTTYKRSRFRDFHDYGAQNRCEIHKFHTIILVRFVIRATMGVKINVHEICAVKSIGFTIHETPM